MAAETPDGPLRVVHLVTDLGKGGAERFLLDLCRALRRRGDVEPVIGSLLDENLYPELSEGLPVRQLGYRTFSFSRGGSVPPAYRSLLEEVRPHVIHTHRYLAEFLSALHLREGAAYVCHGHDNMVQLAPASPRMLADRTRLTNWLEKRLLVRRKYRRARTAFVANSRHTLDYYRRVLPGFMRGDVRLIPPGFDYGRFHRAGTRPPLAGRTLRLVNVGSFQEKKNQVFLVDVARALRDRGVDFRIDLLGDGPTRPRVEAAVAKRGLADRIRFHGNVDRVEAWLWESDVYVHAAWYEPFGLVLLEAMAAGLPCVALDGKGDRDVIQDGRNGFLLETQDADAFAERIHRLRDAPGRYAEMAEEARAFARAYDIDAIAGRFVDFYRAWWDEARYRGG